MKWRVACVTLSCLMMLASVVGVWMPGPNLGTDFRGGTEVELAFKQDVTDEAIRVAVTSVGFSSPDVIRVNDADNPNRFLVRVQEVSTIGPEAQAEINAALCYGEGLDPARCSEDQQASEVKFSPGGEKLTIRFRNAPDLDWIRTALSGGVGGIVLGGNPYLQNERENRVEVQLKGKGDQLLDALKTELGSELVPERPLRIEWVGPKAGAQLRDAALKSIGISLVFMMLYIAVRFDLRFAPGAVFALLHDALVTFGILIFLGHEISLITVAALLTIVGYSVNDTVVIYDRVRENFSKLRGTPLLRVMDISLSECLNRSMVTTGGTILSLLAFFYWGTGALQEFAFTLVVGMLLGAYSTLYIALPITYWIDRTFFKKESSEKRSPPRARKAEAVV